MGPLVFDSGAEFRWELRQILGRRMVFRHTGQGKAQERRHARSTQQRFLDQQPD
jgi:hypothetical protein